MTGKQLKAMILNTDRCLNLERTKKLLARGEKKVREIKAGEMKAREKETQPARAKNVG